MVASSCDTERSSAEEQVLDLMQFFCFAWNVNSSFRGTVQFSFPDTISSYDGKPLQLAVQVSDSGTCVFRDTPPDKEVSYEIKAPAREFLHIYSGQASATEMVRMGLTGKLQMRPFNVMQMRQFANCFDFSQEKWDEFYKLAHEVRQPQSGHLVFSTQLLHEAATNRPNTAAAAAAAAAAATQAHPTKPRLAPPTYDPSEVLGEVERAFRVCLAAYDLEAGQIQLVESILSEGALEGREDEEVLPKVLTEKEILENLRSEASGVSQAQVDTAPVPQEAPVAAGAGAGAGADSTAAAAAAAAPPLPAPSATIPLAQETHSLGAAAAAARREDREGEGEGDQVPQRPPPLAEVLPRDPLVVAQEAAVHRVAEAQAAQPPAGGSGGQEEEEE
eukprot:CAMPEP_0113943994 /NCGR_PEP_ID=MMETSP1339-20121228/30386_1 /TAXON_ID=94617 /ORGANISM="Fibrocapsa japonica" /LENGTH=388 /DNA_ID=CAMNT_0000949023 /DNA_START=155 /DNA_END=1318 /DNA_ORIENTATION=- /assembly_acc=CAM_ASM_000762